MRRPLVASLAVAAALCGCGESGPTDSEQVHAAVEAFGTASAAKDYQRLCDELLAPKLVAEVEAAGLPCEVAMGQGLGEVDAPQLAIGKVAVNGDEATAEVRSTAEGQEPSNDVMQLVRVNDSWRIAALK